MPLQVDTCTISYHHYFHLYNYRPAITIVQRGHNIASSPIQDNEALVIHREDKTITDLIYAVGEGGVISDKFLFLSIIQ